MKSLLPQTISIKFIKIKRITILPPEQVYDIEVEGTHNFVAGHFIDRETDKALATEEEAEILKILNPTLKQVQG